MAITTRIIVGAMTGTSIDGLDLALVQVRGRGLGLKAALLASSATSLGRPAPRLRAVAEQRPLSAGAIAALSYDFSTLHGEAINRLLTRHQAKADLLSIHGQTVFHAPPVSWQMLTPAVIHHLTGVPVVSDLRAADLAAGGQGAPLTPLADLLLFGHRQEARVVINLGGFCNLTRLPAMGTAKAAVKDKAPGKITNRSRVPAWLSGGDDGAAGVRGGDVCACNQILDAVARAVLHQPFDPDGQHALAGTADAAACADLQRRLERQRHARRSLGTGDELGEWLEAHRHLAANDLARSATTAIARTIAAAAEVAGPTGEDRQHLTHHPQRLILAGGGVRNQALVADLRSASNVPVEASDQHGVPAGMREAMAWAVLGALAQDRVPVTLSAITGVERAPLAGTWTGLP